MKKTLLYGFEGFRGYKDNPSSHVINALQKALDDQRYLFNVFEVDYRSVQTEITGLFSKEDIGVVIGFGVNPGSSQIALERVSYNKISVEEKDEKSYSPSSEFIKEGMPSLYETGFDLAHIAEAVEEISIDITISTSPGFYLCNYSYFIASGALSNKFENTVNIPALFVHLPFPTELNEEYGFGKNDMTIDSIVNACGTIISHVDKSMQC